MTGTGTGALAARTARLGAWLVLPLLSLGVLRLFPPLALATDGSKACNRKVEVRPLLGE